MTLGVASALALSWIGLRSFIPEARLLAAPKRSLAVPVDDLRGPPSEDERSRSFHAPSGEAPRLSCEEARAVIAQVRKNLAYAPDPLAPKAFAQAITDWLDPYGLWSASPDAPVSAVLQKSAAGMLGDLEGRGSLECAAALEPARALKAWVNDLRAIYDGARDASDGSDARDDRSTKPDEAATSGGLFEGATITRPARKLAALLGQDVGVVVHAIGDASAVYATTARDRYFPDLDEAEWARVILAAAVRAYVPMVDPHGEWAPLDEEASVYDVDLEAHPPLRLWAKATRTALGARVDSSGVAPLQDGDVILSLAGVATAGLSQEQLDQLALSASDAKGGTPAVVLRDGKSALLDLDLDTSSEDKGATLAVGRDDDPPAERIAFGSGDALIVPIKDVRDDLGDVLTHTLLEAREHPGRAILGVVLDLRGNGGGSTDGAYEAIGIFLPGATLFPMKRRDGAVEPDRAPLPPNVDRWSGPVATLVDGDTASAAEMIAGALSSYRRGPSVGTTTFGKGCAQEYLDDDARAGVLRLTTLLYALPDGSAVQRIGLTPNIRVPFALGAGSGPHDREAELPHAPPTWRGPDVRDPALFAHAEDGAWSVAWPAHGGEVGPCKDADVCRALRALGGMTAATTTAKRAAKAR